MLWSQFIRFPCRCRSFFSEENNKDMISLSESFQNNVTEKKGVHNDWMEKKTSSERLNITCSHFPTTERTNKTTRRTQLNNMCFKFSTLFMPAGMLSFQMEYIQIGCPGKILTGLAWHVNAERNAKDPASSSQVLINYDTSKDKSITLFFPVRQRLKQSGWACGRGW